MMALMCMLGVFLLLMCALPMVDAVAFTHFYPFGDLWGDLSMESGDDISTNEIDLEETVVFFNLSFRAIYVNINGHVSFDSEVPDYRGDQVLPFGLYLIAVYLADVDTRVAGQVYFRSTSDPTLIQRAAMDIRTNFTGFESFLPSSLFIVTWDRVGYYQEQADKLNTFQLVLASDGRDSFAIHHYLDHEIKWTKSQGKFMPTHYDTPPQAGFDGGEGGNFYLLPGSAVSGAFVNGTNVNIPGVWMHHIGNTGSGNIKGTDANIGEVTLFEVGTHQDNCFQGSTVCHANAECIDRESGICCACVSPFYGNGFHCLEPGIPQKINGRVYGNLNGIPLDDGSLMHTYVVTADGRTYSAISQLPPNLGSAMQTLNSIGGIIGWLFAVPMSGKVNNGYSFTGGVLNRTARVTYHSPDRGDYVVRIHQIFSGHDSLNGIRMETRLEGNLPDVPIGATVSIDDYNENYKRTASGIIKSFVARTYRVNDVAYRYTWDNTITFKECNHQASMTSSDVMRLAVTRHYVKYFDDKNVRYAMTSKMGLFLASDPCIEIAQKCDQNADCVLHRSLYRCMCRTGYYGNGETCEADGRLCGEDICNINARCAFTEDSSKPRCVCNVGFQGNGIRCTARELSCKDADICSDDAQCVYDENLRQYYCECIDEISGDGAPSCEPTRIGCAECDRNAKCVFDNVRSTHTCHCGAGYTGDGKYCTLIDICAKCDRNARCEFNNEVSDYQCVCTRGYMSDGTNCQLRDCREDVTMCDPDGGVCWLDTSRNVSICRCRYGFRGDGLNCQPTGCDVFFDCDSNAKCESDGSKYVCQCNEGFVGDGKRCRPQPRISESGCDVLNDCDDHARCVPDTENPNQYICRCNPGYHGDGKFCLLRSTPCNQVNNCDLNAECVYDADTTTYICRCIKGYDGDGLMCIKREVIDCRRSPEMCSSDAECVHGVEDVYVCVCKPGYRGDGALCSSVVHEGNYLIYAQGNKVMRISAENRAGDYGQQIIFIPGMLAVGVDTDCQESDIYWTDAAMGLIRHAKLNGSDVVTLVTGLKSPEGIAIDFAARNMFFTDSELDILQVSRLDGSYVKTLVNTDMVNPRAIILDINRGVIFWTDWNRNHPQIERINMDGSQRKVLVSDGLRLPNGLTFDTFSQILCWGDAGTSSINCIRSDGEGRRILFDKAAYPFDITFLNNILYWTDWKRKDIPNINQNGGEVNQALKQAVGGNGRVYGITAVKDYCPRVRSPCALNNGGCKYLCLASAHGGRTCVCPDDIDPRICQSS